MKEVTQRDVWKRTRKGQALERIYYIDELKIQPKSYLEKRCFPEYYRDVLRVRRVGDKMVRCYDILLGISSWWMAGEVYQISIQHY